MRYAIGCLLDYNYFDDYNKAMTIDLSKQKAVDVEQKAMKSRKKSSCKYNNIFIIEEVKENILDFSKGTMKVLWIYFYFNIISI